MTKRVFFVLIGCMALLTLLALSIRRGTAQTAPDERAPNAPGEVDQKSSYIPVQGRLTDESGSPLNGTFGISFRIYDVYSGGTALCSDLDNAVNVENGLFSAYMNMLNCDAFDGRQLYLGIQVAPDAEMTPRQYIDNVPYAYGLRPGAVISDTLASDAILHIENWGDGGRGLRSYGMAQTGENYGVVGASRSPAGFGGYFYNTAGGVGLKAESDNGNAITANSENDKTVVATNTNDIAVWGSSTNASGVHGASGTAAGVEGFSLLGPGVYGESLGGVAIAANGVITSTEPTYLWISGNAVRPFFHNDSTYIDFNSRGGARIYRGDVAGVKNVVLPITIAGTLYGQDVRLTEIELYWKGDTDMDSIMTIRLRRQTGVCAACYAEILADTADYTCWEDSFANGCTISNDLTAHNVLTSESGILYLTLEIGFAGATWIDFDGARLTLEYDE